MGPLDDTILKYHPVWHLKYPVTDTDIRGTEKKAN